MKSKKKDPCALKEREVPQPSLPPQLARLTTSWLVGALSALVQSVMDCLYAKCMSCITDCVMAKIGAKVSSGSKDCQGSEL